MSGPKINNVNSSFSGVGAFSFPGVQESSLANPLEGASNIKRSGTIVPSQSKAAKAPEPSAEVPRQAAINRELLTKQLPVLTEIASRGRVALPQSAAALNEIKALTKNHTIPKETYKQLEKCNKEFTKCFQALSKMTVADVHAMFNADAPTKCSKLFNAIDQCFGNIDEQLLSLINNPETRSGSIERLQEDYALMYSRLRTAMMSCAEGNLDPKATIASIVNKVAASMSGSVGVLEAVKDEIAPILTGLANAGKPGADTLQVGRVIADAEQAIATLQRIKTEGVQVGNGRTIPMQSDMDALIATLQNAITNVKQHTNQGLGTGIERAVDRLLITNDLTKNLSYPAQRFLMTNPNIAIVWKAIEKVTNSIAPDKILEMAKNYTAPTGDKPAQSELMNAIHSLNEKLLGALPRKAFTAAMQAMLVTTQTMDQRVQNGEDTPAARMWNVMGGGTKQEIIKLLDTLYNRLFFLTHPEMMNKELTHIEQMVNVYSGKESGQIRQSDYKAMIAGNLDAGTVMLTYASGLNSRHIDTETHNAQITKSKHLGSGMANDVQLISYKGTNVAGETVTYNRVFKPAMEARVGLDKVLSAKLSGYSDTQNIIQTNVGAGYMAEKIGAKNVISVSRFGVVNGVPGILMDQAKGIDASECPRKYASKFAKLSADKQNIVRGNLMRELNRLQWADILSGQVDRHYQNYLIDINFDTLDVNVTGIDNDACCGKNMVGMRALRISVNGFEALSEGQTNVTQGITKQMEGDPPKVTGYICDMPKMDPAMRSKLLGEIGAHAMCLPTVIDTETARHIESIDLDTYANDLREILQDEKSIQAAVSRLKDAKAYVSQLAAEGKVIDADAWGNADTQKKIAQGQQKHANTLLGTTQSDPDDSFVSYRSFELFWRDFKFMAPSTWTLPPQN